MLSIRQVSAGYPGVPVLTELSLEVPAGRLTGLIGANGAGKSTLFDVVCGRLRARRGRILLDGRDVTRTPTHRRARLGLGRTYQRLEVFGSLSVAENLLVAARATGAEDPARAVAETLRRLGLADFAAYPAGKLPTGVARLVEIARALAGGAGVLLLDEPSSGMAAAELAEFAESLRALAADGLALLMIEHDLELVDAVCDDVYELRDGQVLPRAGRPD
ncbi:ATP-binding cassette domain-containing protein [Actinospica sp. MGRD01-02]|uniref:ATP-binding cassette domain-containing protein n=1 Tax=Actinospica acidithermotolerans TaxID=2828514 RepID=A0A941E966_9ACTN|nr:ATP-binding cassette domain-containing protein [Actinospica acidithermotolerans]MBR7825850.1 ATP-binding cassette domain-containing protein [Actinospica acidithermotolerans]